MDAALFAGKHSDRPEGERDATRQTFPGSEVDETFAAMVPVVFSLYCLVKTT